MSVCYREYEHPVSKVKHTVLLVLYTGEFNFQGCVAVVRIALVESHAHCGFAPESITDPEMRTIVGLNVYRAPTDKTVQKVFLSQTGYITTICEKFVGELGLAGPHALKAISTPCKAHGDESDKRKRHKVRKHIGRHVWMSRGTRAGVSYVVCKLSRRQNMKTRRSSVFRSYRYLGCARFIGLWLVFTTAEIEQLAQYLFVDSDHNNDAACTQTPTSGNIVILGASRSRMALTWGCHLQTATARNIGEAKVVGAWDGVFVSAAPRESFFEQCLEVIFNHQTLIDNGAARVAISKGASRRLSYVRKHQRVSISSLHAHHQPEHRNLGRPRVVFSQRDLTTSPTGDACVKSAWARSRRLTRL